MTLTVTLCAEDSLAAGVSAQLFDRTIAERARAQWLRDLWVDPDLRATQRRVVDFDDRDGWSNRSHVGEVEARGRRRVHPRDPETNRSLGGNAALAYKCVRLAAALPLDGPHALLLAFDADQKPVDQHCRTGVVAATRDATLDFVVVVAEPQPEFDAWVIAGFVPASQRDHDEVAAIREHLRAAGHSIHPVAEPHRLTSTVAGDPRDAKSLCQRLLGLDAQAGPDEPAVLACVDALPLTPPPERLADVRAFVDDVERGVLPLLGDDPPPPPLSVP